MKLGAGDVSGFLAAPDKRSQGALVYGPDDGLVRERVKAIALKIVSDLADPFTVVELTEEQILADPPRLRDELAAMSFTGDRRLVMVRGAGDRFGAIASEALEGLDAKCGYLLVQAEELSPRSPLRLLFEKEARLAALACYKDDSRSLEQLVRSVLQQSSVRAAPEVMPYLLRRLGNDRAVTMSELDKLVLYLGEEKELTLEVAMRLVGENTEHSLDDVCQAVADRQPVLLEKALSRLAREGIPAIAMLRGVMKYFQRLDYVQALMQNGKTLDEAVAALRPPVFFKQVPALKRHVTEWQRPLLQRAMQRLLETEKDAKSGKFPQETLCHHFFLALSRAQ